MAVGYDVRHSGTWEPPDERYGLGPTNDATHGVLMPRLRVIPGIDKLAEEIEKVQEECERRIERLEGEAEEVKRRLRREAGIEDG